jgi:2-methylcitrate dehydratase PrpD
MTAPQILAVMERVKVIGDPKLNDPAAPRGALVEVILKDGRAVSKLTRFPPGTKENPLDIETINAKARDLMGPVLGADRTEAAIRQLNALEQVGDVAELVRSALTV